MNLHENTKKYDIIIDIERRGIMQLVEKKDNVEKVLCMLVTKLELH